MHNSDELVEKFLEFFREKDHAEVESSSLIPEDDRTLLFTSAGMVQFKPLWTGEEVLDFKRATSVQKCLRLSDLEEVGKTYWHCTFFEMLGNFSFGDYFKERAIEWGWEFLVEGLRINPEKLYVSVYPDDEESYNIWREKMGLEEDRIVKHRDNFWGPAGGLGACGPDTEIFYDLGPEYGECEFDGECERYVELWNIVFPQYEQLEDKRVKLKNRGVDTGMGLERLAMVMQDKSSIFETDLFFPLIKEIEDISGKDYSNHREIFNIIADHVRALTLAISDGVYPSNEGRGYVLRRLIRRAYTRARKIDIKDAFIHKLANTVVSMMKNRYPVLKEKMEQISLVLKSEEESFIRTLSTGVDILSDIIESKKKEGRDEIRGEEAFRLYDTYGFPLTLTEEIAEEHEMKVDKKGFEKEMEKQKERARREEEFQAERNVGWNIISDEDSEFVGYDKREVETRIIAYREINGNLELILRETPFYAEQGGQIGDKGLIETENWKLRVEDTYISSLGNVHRGQLEGAFDDSSPVHAIIDRDRRYAIEKNHTTTHILHRVLKEVLGDWVRQEGSLVAPDHFRFDFTHPGKIEEEELERIEREVNKVITRGLPVEAEILPYKRAMEKGAVALFEENYGEEVRMVTIDDFTRELCGGTHLHNTVEAGMFKIISESSIAAGIRRIEGVTGWSAYKRVNRLEKIIQDVEFYMDTDRSSLVNRIEKMLQKQKEQKKKIEEFENRLVELEYERIKNRVKVVDNLKYISEKFNGTRSAVRLLADKLQRNLSDVAGLLVSEVDSSVFVVSFVGDELTEKIRAGELIGEACSIVGGGGGGRATIAEGGGNEKEKVGKMINEFPEIIKNKLNRR